MNNGAPVDTDERDGGPAFPAVINDEDEPHPIWFEGMTLRDYFAAKALQGILCNGFMPYNYYDGQYGPHKPYPYAEAAYKLAEEMIKARV